MRRAVCCQNKPMSYGETGLCTLVSQKLKDRVTSVAQRQGITRSELLRRAIEEYLDRAERGQTT